MSSRIHIPNNTKRSHPDFVRRSGTPRASNTNKIPWPRSTFHIPFAARCTGLPLLFGQVATKKIRKKTPRGETPPKKVVSARFFPPDGRRCYIIYKLHIYRTQRIHHFHIDLFIVYTFQMHAHRTFDDAALLPHVHWALYKFSFQYRAKRKLEELVSKVRLMCGSIGNISMRLYEAMRPFRSMCCEYACLCVRYIRAEHQTAHRMRYDGLDIKLNSHSLS